MKVRQELKGNYTLYTQDAEGEVELNQALKKLEVSSVFQLTGELSNEVLGGLQEVKSELEENYALFIFVDNDSLKKGIEELGSEFIIYLPTLHEAEEAIMMNELEKQFRSEMGEE
ncbi:hypothetical protein [Jiulongibacter sediminis]|jgi:hypothetical protein|uniref:hypothetical protein n=1 Tax=Jiulongibacter sediminis TaxID=1605367 RepID=UPI0026EA6E65|nr:hypothetical protein [Jiulongibacter sediminis]